MELHPSKTGGHDAPSKRGHEESGSSGGGRRGNSGSPGGDHTRGAPTLTAMTIVRDCFHYLEGSLDIVNASATCRRWKELARDDLVWTLAKARREGIVDKAIAFELDDVPGVNYCSICFKAMDEPIQLPCTHAYCRACLVTWRGRAQAQAPPNCPQCRAPLPDPLPLSKVAGNSGSEDGVFGWTLYAKITQLRGYMMLNDTIRDAVVLWREDPDSCKAEYGPMSSWDTSGVDNMARLFYGLTNFNEDISRWNVSNVITMRALFAETNFNRNISRWNVRNVRNMWHTFYNARRFNCDISGWDVAKVESMNYCFCHATSFDHRLGGAWSTSTADKNETFAGCPGSFAP